ncbi:leucine-rich repeat domain-containing protein [Desulfobacterales bacterium HSG17]|nr:leucine-rich repeat domain-containing protein [Desulfobacterales bacterium HSG17]
MTSGNDYRIRITDISNNSHDDYSDSYFSIVNPLSVTSPNGGETWYIGHKYNIRWETGSSDSDVSIYVFKENDDTLRRLAAQADNTGSWSWMLPDTLIEGDDYRVYIKLFTDESVFDQSDTLFSIKTPPLAPPANLSASDGIYTDKVNISWDSIAGAGYYRVYRNTVLNSNGAIAVSSWQNETTHDDTNVISGLTYYYWVTAAKNTSGDGASSFSDSDSGYSFASDVVNFPDKNLEAIIREKISKPTGEILVSDLNDLISLGAIFEEIKNIEGLQYCINLTELNLGHNQISDINAVANLTNLTRLNFEDNQISDISAVANLTNLTTIDLPSNQINDISAVANLTNLKYLYLSNNQISDISAVAGLSNLTNLMLRFNQISNISAVAGLNNLTLLYLGFNQINDISAVAGLSNLQFLDLESNQINDIGAVAGLFKLQNLGLESNQINDISAVKLLVNLRNLVLSGNQISDIKSLLDKFGTDYRVSFFDNQSGASNPLSTTSCNVYIPQLLNQGVTVEYDCP